MNIIWLFLGALIVSIGWYTGRCIVHTLDDALMNTIKRAYKKNKHKVKQIHLSERGRYHETKMGF